MKKFKRKVNKFAVVTEEPKKSLIDLKKNFKNLKDKLKKCNINDTKEKYDACVNGIRDSFNADFTNQQKELLGKEDKENFESNLKDLIKNYLELKNLEEEKKELNNKREDLMLKLNQCKTFGCSPVQINEYTDQLDKAGNDFNEAKKKQASINDSNKKLKKENTTIIKNKIQANFKRNRKKNK